MAAPSVWSSSGHGVGSVDIDWSTWERDTRASEQAVFDHAFAPDAGEPRPLLQSAKWPVAGPPEARRLQELHDRGVSEDGPLPRIVDLAPGSGGMDRQIFDEVMNEGR